ncbi:hypothetical protein PNI0446_00903 [Streptococcus pneumoniae PNI0446]|nr:hypothetical protein PNI0446_00903 [Streptococcus pneumoniae PNI0446]
MIRAILKPSIKQSDTLYAMIQMIYNDTSDRSGCHRKRAASEILMMTSSVMPC